VRLRDHAGLRRTVLLHSEALPKINRPRTWAAGEWTPKTYNSLEQTPRVSELFALRYVDVAIADARAIQAYLKASLGTEATFIPYGVGVPVLHRGIRPC